MSRIGQWAHRASGSKSHLIESEVEDRFVMRCGRMLGHQLGGDPRGMLIFEPPTWRNPACVQCDGHVPTMNTRSGYR